MKKLYRITLAVLTICFSSAMDMECMAQSMVHDGAKMNQVTVQEIGAGSLTPEAYYAMLHSKYRKEAQEKNKLGYRALAGAAAWKQVEDAEEVDTTLTKRAEIEALNMADRMGGEADLAWMVEGKSIKGKMEALQRNIGRIATVGGSESSRKRWQEVYGMYETAIRSIQESYMPNSERKKAYLKICSDVIRSNQTLIKYLSWMSNSRSGSDILGTGHAQVPDRRAAAAGESYLRWRDAAWQASNNSAN